MRLLLRSIANRLRRGERGTTMIEVLMAAALIAVGVGGAITVFTHSAQGEVVAERSQLSLAQAEQSIEAMRGITYDNLKLKSAPATSTGGDDPNGHVSAGRLDIGSGRLEDLILPTDTSPGTATVDPYERRTIGSGTSAATVRIYRFVTWRDEECPTISLANLNASLTDVASFTTSARGRLDTLTGSSGTLAKLDQDITSAGHLSLVSLLLSQLVGVLAPGDSTATSLNSSLNGLSANLAPLQTAITSFQGRTELDLCDLSPDVIADLRKLAVMRAALPAINTALQTIQTTQTTLDNAVKDLLTTNILLLPTKVTAALLTLPPLVANLVTAKGSLTTALSALGGGSTDGVTYLKSLADDTVQDLNKLLASGSTAHNSKRLTVAAVEETPTGLRKAVWASTVVTDPEAGLLH